jgi:deoxyxylulose-5-phosphate synthase
VLELAAAREINASHVQLRGLPDRFVAAGSRDQQLAEVGLDPSSLAATLQRMVQDHHGPNAKTYTAQK